MSTRGPDRPGPSAPVPPGPLLDDIDLADGTWEDLADDGRWHPAPGDRTRAAVLLAVGLIFLGTVAWIVSLGDDSEGVTAGGDDIAESTGSEEPDGEDEVPGTAGPSTGDADDPDPDDPASLAGVAPPAGCEDDDRGALALRDRQATSIQVLNATPRNGHAGATTDRLATLGYTTVEPGNAGSEPVTVVEHQPGFCAEGARLRDDLGFPTTLLRPMSSQAVQAGPVSELVVTLGDDSL